MSSATRKSGPTPCAAVKFAYPRFVFHDYVLRAAAQGAKKHGLAGRAVYAVASERSAREMAVWMKLSEYAIVAEADFVLMHFADRPEACAAAKAFLQHTGASISSRQAETYLRAEGLLINVQAEERQADGARDKVLTTLRDYLPTPALHLCTSGMNAFYAALKATRRLQAPRGATRLCATGLALPRHDEDPPALSGAGRGGYRADGRLRLGGD